jgi:hypothetical protein
MTKLTQSVKFQVAGKDNHSILSEKEIPQTKEMISLTECLDDKGLALPQALSSQVSDGIIIPYLRFPSGVEEYVPAQTIKGEVQQVPRGTTFVRDQVSGQHLGLPLVSGGSI